MCDKSGKSFVLFRKLSCSSPSNEYVVRVCWVSRALHVLRFLPTSLCLVPVHPEFKRLLNPAHSSTFSSRTWFLVIKHTFLYMFDLPRKKNRELHISLAITSQLVSPQRVSSMHDTVTPAVGGGWREKDQKPIYAVLVISSSESFLISTLQKHLWVIYILVLLFFF